MSIEDKVYHISEIFVSPQGEGLFCGCLTTFIRLAGCSVGKRLPVDRYVKGLPIYTEECTLYDGRKFLCDTNYQPHEKLKATEIAKKVPKDIQHVCITGGEPLNHNLEPLIYFIREKVDKTIQFHIETSGTVPLTKAFPDDDWFNADGIWITVSPKFGVLDDMIRRANEIKILIDEDFDPEKLPELIRKHPLVYAQPVNNELTIDAANLRLTMDWQKKFPNWRVSLQLHKILSEQTGELVR